MNHPSEYFIRYLISIPSQDSQKDEWVQQCVQAIGFPAPEVDLLTTLRNELYRAWPVDYDPTNKYHRESRKFLQEFEIFGLHHADRHIKQSWTILPNHRVRRVVEPLLLGRLTLDDVTRKVNQRLGEHFTVEAIAAYHHYYFNTKKLRTTEWKDFYKQYDNAASSQAAAIACVGPAMALHATGFPQHLDSKTMLQSVQEAMYFDFLSWGSQPTSPAKTKALATLAKSMTSVDQRLAEADSALRDSLKAFEQFRMEHAQGDVDGIDDIAPAGNFSDSGVDMRELPPPEEESSV